MVQPADAAAQLSTGNIWDGPELPGAPVRINGTAHRPSAAIISLALVSHHRFPLVLFPQPERPPEVEDEESGGLACGGPGKCDKSFCFLCEQ